MQSAKKFSCSASPFIVLSSASIAHTGRDASHCDLEGTLHHIGNLVFALTFSIAPEKLGLQIV
jgi:hypothetical protein